MTKEEKKVADTYFKEYGITWRNVHIVAHHYLSLGEQIIETLTPEEIAKTVEEEHKKQEDAEVRGKIYLIDYTFTEFLLKAVVGLFKLPSNVRYKVLIEMLK